MVIDWAEARDEPVEDGVNDRMAKREKKNGMGRGKKKGEALNWKRQ